MTEEESLREQAARLTPREWRVLALVLEGVSTPDACAALGIAPGTFESHKQAIRRKLSVPRGERLERHLKGFATAMARPEQEPGRVALAASRKPPTVERRIRLLYRMTIEELLEVASNADLRARLLDQTVRRMSADGIPEANVEVHDLGRAATEIRTTVDRLLSEVRADRAANVQAVREDAEQEASVSPDNTPAKT